MYVENILRWLVRKQTPSFGEIWGKNELRAKNPNKKGRNRFTNQKHNRQITRSSIRQIIRFRLFTARRYRNHSFLTNYSNYPISIYLILLKLIICSYQDRY